MTRPGVPTTTWAPRSRRDEVGLDASAADEAERGEAVELAEVVDDIAHLLGELARRNEDDGLDGVVRGIDGPSEGEAEGDGLAGTGLGKADNVFAVEEEWEGCRLDGRGGFVAERGNGVEARLVDAELAEFFAVRRERRRQFRARGRRGANVRRLSGGVLVPATATSAAARRWCRFDGGGRVAMVSGELWAGRGLVGGLVESGGGAA